MFCQAKCINKRACRHKPVRAERNQQFPISPWFILRLMINCLIVWFHPSHELGEYFILIHFLVSHHRGAVQFFVSSSQILTDLMRSKPDDILTAPRHPRRPEPVVKERLPASQHLLLDRIVVLILEVSQARATAVAHGDSEFSVVYTPPCHLSLDRPPAFSRHSSWDLQQCTAPPTAVCSSSKRWMTQRSLLSQLPHLIHCWQQHSNVILSSCSPQEIVKL